MNDARIKCQVNMAANCVEFYLWDYSGPTTKVATGITVEDPIEDFVKPFLELTHGQAKSLMTDMWRQGIRPVDLPEEATPMLIESLKEHIDDLRRISYKGLGIK